MLVLSSTCLLICFPIERFKRSCSGICIRFEDLCYEGSSPAVEILLLLFSCIFSGSTLYTRSRKSYSLYISIHWVHGRKLTDPQMALMENKESMTWLNVWWPSISWYQERHTFRMYQPNHHYHLQNWPA